jgi:hypothetical protein
MFVLATWSRPVIHDSRFGQDFLFGFLAGTDYTSKRSFRSRLSHLSHPERLQALWTKGIGGKVASTNQKPFLVDGFVLIPSAKRSVAGLR